MELGEVMKQHRNHGSQIRGRGEIQCLFILSIFVLFFSCSEDRSKGKKVQSRKLYGWWAIDTIHINNEDIKSCYLTNMVKIDKNTIALPSLNPICLDYYGPFIVNPSWYMNESMDTIYLNGGDWSGSYMYRIINDNFNKTYRIQIFGNNKYIAMLRIW
jgi:hypothetical protein